MDNIIDQLSDEELDRRDGIKERVLQYFSDNYSVTDRFDCDVSNQINENRRQLYMVARNELNKILFNQLEIPTEDQILKHIHEDLTDYYNDYINDRLK
jgi:hypothetical protein